MILSSSTTSSDMIPHPSPASTSTTQATPLSCRMPVIASPARLCASSTKSPMSTLSTGRVKSTPNSTFASFVGLGPPRKVPSTRGGATVATSTSVSVPSAALSGTVKLYFEPHTATKSPSVSAASATVKSLFSPASLSSSADSLTGATASQLAVLSRDRDMRISRSVPNVPPSVPADSHTASQAPRPSATARGYLSAPKPSSAAFGLSTRWVCHVAPSSDENAYQTSASLPYSPSGSSEECQTPTQLPSPSVAISGFESMPVSVPARLFSGAGALQVTPLSTERA